MTARRIGIFYMARSNNGGTQVPLPNGGSVWIRVEEAPAGATLVNAMDGVVLQPPDETVMNSHDLVPGPWDDAS